MSEELLLTQWNVIIQEKEAEDKGWRFRFRARKILLLQTIEQYSVARILGARPELTMEKCAKTQMEYRTMYKLSIVMKPTKCVWNSFHWPTSIPWSVSFGL